MTATDQIVSKVAPFTGYGRELLWEEGGYGTSVVVDRDGLLSDETVISRNGKGDKLFVDLAPVLHSVAIVRDGHGEARAYLSTTIEADFVVVFTGNRLTIIVDTIEQALVELAFEYIS